MDEDPERRRNVDPLLIRIDERTMSIVEELKQLRTTVVSKAEFNPIRLLVYGLVGLVLTAVFTAVVAQVVVSK